MGCGCLSIGLHSCSTAPITDRRQLKILPESKLNAQAAQIYEKVKEKEKMSEDIKTLNLIKKIGSKVKDFSVGDRVAYAGVPLGAYSSERNYPIRNFYLNLTFQ